ncbi:MAG: hypothetical protein ACYC96_08515 [Fimbriimonadaceae bacterium]
MEARKFATQLAAICPFALLLGMGYSARQAVSGFQVLHYSDAQNARIEAYRPVVMNSIPLEADAPMIRRHADRWIHLALVAHLPALTPAYEEDLFEDNARSEIIAEWRWLLLHLNDTMRRELADGQFTLAVQDGTRLVRLDEILKYSDFEALHLATVATTHAVALIGPVLPRVPELDQHNFARAARTVARNREKLPALYRVLEANFEDYQVRRIGFSRALDGESGVAFDSDTNNLGMDATQLQRAYVLAVRDETTFRAKAHVFLGLAFSPAKS